MAWKKNFYSPKLAPLKVVALTLAFTLPTAHAGIYQWVDEEGGVHYGERPPPKGEYRKIKSGNQQPSNAQSSNERLNRLLEQQKASEESRKQRNEEAQTKSSNEKIRQQNCDTARKNLALLESISRPRIKNADGSVTRLTEEQRQAQLTETKEKVKEFCD